MCDDREFVGEVAVYFVCKCCVFAMILFRSSNCTEHCVAGVVVVFLITSYTEWHAASGSSGWLHSSQPPYIAAIGQSTFKLKLWGRSTVHVLLLHCAFGVAGNWCSPVCDWLAEWASGAIAVGDLHPRLCSTSWCFKH